MENRISKLEAYDKMMATNGKLFTVEFVKRDGSLRTMNCRLNVTKHLKGGKPAYDAFSKALLHVYDMVSKGYRTVNLETVFKLRSNKKEYEVV
jgi:hypothetical protein